MSFFSGFRLLGFRMVFLTFGDKKIKKKLHGKSTFFIFYKSWSNMFSFVKGTCVSLQKSGFLFFSRDTTVPLVKAHVFFRASHTLYLSEEKNTCYFFLRGTDNPLGKGKTYFFEKNDRASHGGTH